MTREKKLEKLLKTMQSDFAHLKNLRASTPFDMMVLAILIPGNTTIVPRALKALAKEFVDWNEIRVSSWKEIGTVLEGAGLKKPGEKAISLKKSLEAVFSETHRMDLDGLKELPLDKAAALLGKFRDFDEGALAAVLYLSLELKKLLPTPSIVRVSHRIGFIVKTPSIPKMKVTLRDWVRRRHIFHFHTALAHIARKFCFEKATFCEKCPALEVCQHGTSVIGRMPRIVDDPKATKKPAPKASRTVKKRK